VDLFILDAFAKMRFLTTTQIATLAFDWSRWAAHKRLRKLLDGGLIRVWARSPNKENVYSLDREGAKLFGESPSIPRILDGTLDHLLGINQVPSLAPSRSPAWAENSFAGARTGNSGPSSARRSFLTPCSRSAGTTAFFQHFALEVERHSRSTRGS
jgi:hypothetical protein